MTPDQLRELLEKATPGPWESEPTPDAPEAQASVFGPRNERSWREVIILNGPSDDARLVVSLRNLAPKLLELWEATERYREDVRNLDDWLRVLEALQALEDGR